MDEISGLIYQGPPFHSGELDSIDLPSDLTTILKQGNGFVCLYGGLHVRGLCSDPEWHALSAVSQGPRALQNHYEAISEKDIAFAEDCFGDQFVLRNGQVHRLYAETGQLCALSLGLTEFFERMTDDTSDFLDLPEFLHNWYVEGRLTPNRAVHVYPPFCMENTSDDYSFKPILRTELMEYHFALSRRLRDLPDGAEMEFRVTD